VGGERPIGGESRKLRRARREIVSPPIEIEAKRSRPKDNVVSGEEDGEKDRGGGLGERGVGGPVAKGRWERSAGKGD